MDFMNYLTRDSYERITDDIIYLGQNIILRFCVSLANYDKNGERSSYHKEFAYTFNNNLACTIRRNFNAYLSFDNISQQNSEKKESVRIGIEDMYLFIEGLKNVIGWYYSNDIYYNDNGNLILNNKPQPIRIVNSKQKYIEFQAIVIENNLGQQDRGCRIFLNSDSNYTNITIDRLMALWYIISNFNIYQSAQLMLNYFQKPQKQESNISFINPNNSSNQNNNIVKTKFLPPRSVENKFNNSIND